ncbi:MAG: response regulator [Prolixibacteraceae bacterium]|nr:response regulator [Prolixibacteraceae bacterium]
MTTLLIVDDKSENIYFLETLFNAKKIKTITANNGAYALDLARKNPPDLIISDILMPVMDGFSLCMEWKKDSVLKKIPFIFYTATYTDAKDAEFALNLGADRFIIKPQEPEDFMKIIEEVLTEFKLGKIHTKQPRIKTEEVLIKDYNSVLVRKLEDKLVQAEQSDKKLRRYTAELEQHLEKIKLSEQKLAKSEGLYKKLFNEDLTGNYIKTPDGKILLCNPSFVKIFGFESLEEAIGFNIKSLYHNIVNRDLLTDEIKKKGKVESFGIWMKKKNGQLIHIVENAIGTFNEKNELLEIKGYIFENTALKLAEKELTKLSLAIEQNPASIIITGTDGNIEYVNPKFTELTGYSSEEITGKNPRILKSGKTSGEEYKNLWDTISSGKIWFGEFQNCKKNGEIFYEMASISPIIDDSGNITNYLAVKKDITEQKKAVDALQKSEDKYRKIFENVQDVFYQIDLNGMITEISPSIFQLAGYKREELIGTPVISFYYDIQERDSMLDILSQKGEVWDFEVRLIIKSSQVKYASLNAHIMVDENNKEIGIEGSLRDIDKRKHIEIELIAAKEKAEESDHLKTAFLHNISHEIRTPLNAIVGFSAILSDPSLPLEKHKKYSEIIVKSSDHLLSIISDIINISTIEAGQEKLSLVNTNINSKFKLLYEQFSPRAKEKNISFRYNITLSDSESITLLDETKILQILTNLLVNAFKFTQQGDVSFGYHLKENYLEFYVEDTGIGIPPELHESVFERFRQVETTATRHYGGSGLGLSISKAYVEMLGGKIWLNSEIGKGSVFYFTVPYKKENQELKADTQIINEITENNKPKTLLIAEDEEYNFMFIEELLSDESYTLIRANNGIEAIEICKSNSLIDLVLMDIKMPVMNGYEATKQIKKIRPDLPIIAQTAYSTESDKNKALESGCSDFISKPFNKEGLLTKISEQLNK